MTIRYNVRRERYEVYGKKSVKRNGKLMPVCVCETREKAEEYIKRCNEK